jgi:hypothetical protein
VLNDEHLRAVTVLEALVEFDQQHLMQLGPSCQGGGMHHVVNTEDEDILRFNKSTVVADEDVGKRTSKTHTLNTGT